MLNRIMVTLALISLVAQASQTPKPIQLPLDVTSIIVSHICKGKGPWVHSLRAIKNLNTTNKQWHTALNTHTIFKQIVLEISQKADGYDEIMIAKSMRRWPAFKNAEFQDWFGTRTAERTIENELFHATICNRNDKIKKLMREEKININARDKSGKTALSIAASSSERIDALQEILKYHPDINLANKNGWTPLKKAADEGNIEAVTLLLSAGADANKADNEGYTPLLNAAFKNNIEIMKALIAAYANVNHQSYHDKHTALMWAVCNDSPKAVTLLLDSGAQKDLINESITALYIAKKRNNRTMQLMLTDDSQSESGKFLCPRT